MQIFISPACHEHISALCPFSTGQGRKADSPARLGRPPSKNTTLGCIREARTHTHTYTLVLDPLFMLPTVVPVHKSKSKMFPQGGPLPPPVPPPSLSASIRRAAPLIVRSTGRSVTFTSRVTTSSLRCTNVARMLEPSGYRSVDETSVQRDKEI